MSDQAAQRDADAGAVLACIGLGSNVGDRDATLRSAVAALRDLERTEVVAVSEFIQTEPVAPAEALRAGLDPGGPYLNGAAAVRTGLSARALLEALLEIERRHGRDRTGAPRWGPRTLDLDLLLYGDRILDEPGLTVPHPRMHEREFVLRPLVQVAPDVVVPTLGCTVRELRERFAAGGAR